jgi:excisionase family DNA binding protein
MSQRHEEMLTINKAAEYLGVHRRTIWKRIKAGEIVAQQNGVDKRQRLIAICELEKLRSFSGEDVDKERAG